MISCYSILGIFALITLVSSARRDFGAHSGYVVAVSSFVVQSLTPALFVQSVFVFLQVKSWLAYNSDNLLFQYGSPSHLHNDKSVFITLQASHFALTVCVLHFAMDPSGYQFSSVPRLVYNLVSTIQFALLVTMFTQVLFHWCVNEISLNSHFDREMP
jgi:hypothetical protein